MIWDTQTLVEERPAARVGIRPAEQSDAGAVAAMHERCSADSLRRRYHAPTPTMSPSRLALLLAPAGGLCLVATAAHHEGEVVVATGMAVRHGTDAEVALLVEDRCQRTGIGTRLLYALASTLGPEGVTHVVLECRPDNRAVPALIHRAGYRARASFRGGCCRYELVLPEWRTVTPLAPS